MPVKTVKRGDKFRIIEANTGRIAKNKGGTALDGGGYKSKDKAKAQVSAVNISLKGR
jgi:hypothetical protein